jgi:hypothetical protein
VPDDPALPGISSLVTSPHPATRNVATGSVSVKMALRMRVLDCAPDSPREQCRPSRLERQSPNTCANSTCPISTVISATFVVLLGE